MKQVYTISQLDPTSTYEFKLIALFEGGKQSKESGTTMIDTNVSTAVNPNLMLHPVMIIFRLPVVLLMSEAAAAR